MQLAQGIYPQEEGGAQDENTKLKCMVADLSLDKVMLQDVMSSKL